MFPVYSINAATTEAVTISSMPHIAFQETFSFKKQAAMAVATAKSAVIIAVTVGEFPAANANLAAINAPPAESPESKMKRISLK